MLLSWKGKAETQSGQSTRLDLLHPPSNPRLVHVAQLR